MNQLCKMDWCLTGLTFMLVCALPVILAQEPEVYNGKFLGKFNSYHHQVGGEVYAVDDSTFLIKSFVYDGNGPDTFFYAGSSVRPSSQGIIIPNEHGRTNVLKAYLNKDFTLKMPEGKKITDIKWLSVFDLTLRENFGDISIPEGFEPPIAQALTELSRRAHKVSSGPVEVLDSKTIKINQLNYDGLGTDAYFWIGVGPQPSVKGFKVPDERGYVSKLRAYREEDVTIQLPSELTVFDIDWFAIFNVETAENFGSIIIPDDLNVPPSLIRTLPHDSSLPNCETLHRDVHVSWEIFGPAMTIEIAARIGTPNCAHVLVPHQVPKINQSANPCRKWRVAIGSVLITCRDDDEYVAFGLSGSETSAQMEGADVALLYMDQFQGYAKDYNVTAKSTCVSVLGAYRGVCSDEQVGGTDNNQFFLSSRKDGLTTITYRRSLNPPEPGDQAIPTDHPASIIWAVGKLNKFKRPTFHRLWSRDPVFIEFGRSAAKRNCGGFMDIKETAPKPWGPFMILEPTLRLFTLRLGPSGGARGYEGITGQTGSDLAWYVNGFLAPELYLRRELTYNFQVEGGNDPHSATHYHPLTVTDEPVGGYESMNEEARRSVRVLAGIEFTRRGQPRPTAAGRLCLWRHSNEKRDRRLDSDIPTFQKFRNTLKLYCEEGGQAANMELRPDNSWPDVVYYHSYTHPGMGWKINIVDRFSNLNTAALASPSSPAASAASLPLYSATLLCVTLALLLRIRVVL